MAEGHTPAAPSAGDGSALSPDATGLQASLQTALGATYRLERELGGGGMSRVFVATETALRRRVVVKVLAPELTQGLSAERFAREIGLAAALQHPHIVPVLSAGDAGGIPYYTMPFVEGESLRARLLAPREGGRPMSLTESVGILRDVALALEYAHAHGVVHRDIKPENVLLSGRTAVVADFGIARAVSAAMADGATRGATLTSVGQSLGTPGYMSPEQAVGDPADHRADLYAWGIMAYEVLAGRHPFADRATAQRLIAAHLSERPVPLGEVVPGLPVPLAALVMRCTEKEPAARPQGVTEVLEALDALGSGGTRQETTTAAREVVPTAAVPTGVRAPRSRLAAIGGAVAAVVVIGAVLFAWNAAEPPTGTSASAADAGAAFSIAVLPFENLGDSTDAYFADGMADELRGKLTQLPGTRVIARGSSVQYRGTTKSPAVVAQELGVRYLLTGTVRYAHGGSTGDRVQVRPELVEIMPSGASESRWQQPFEADFKDVFRVQGEIAEQVASAMRVVVGAPDQQRLVSVPTRSPEAYDAFLRGEAAWSGGANAAPAAIQRAIAHFEQAVARDSTFEMAWFKLAVANANLLAFSTSPPPKAREAVRAAALRVKALDPDGPLGHRAMATIYSSIDPDPVKRLEEAEAALRKSPGDPELRAVVASSKHGLGRLEEAARDRAAALLLEPRNARTWMAHAANLIQLRRHAEARAAAERAVALVPSVASAWLSRVQVEVAVGDLAAARRVLAEAKAHVPADALVAHIAIYDDLGWVLEDADARLLLTLGPDAFDDDRATWAIVRAQMYHWRGDSVLARAWGDSAYRNMRAVPNTHLASDPQWRVFLGLAQAYAGRGTEAIVEGERALALAASDRAIEPYIVYVLARTYRLAGQPDKAIDMLERVLRLPYMTTSAMLGIDPSWQPLRGNPRFERLVRGG